MKEKMKKEKQFENVRNVNLNEGILYDFLQVISHDGNNLGKMSKLEALQLAQINNLDLVIVSESSKEGSLPVAKIMNYSKKLYEEKKKSSLAKKKNVETKVKEIRLSIKISNYDLGYKMDQGIKFLISGFRVKVSLLLKGRERALKDTLGIALMDKVTAMLGGVREKVGSRELAFDQEGDGSFGLSRVFYLKK